MPLLSIAAAPSPAETAGLLFFHNLRAQPMPLSLLMAEPSPTHGAAVCNSPTVRQRPMQQGPSTAALPAVPGVVDYFSLGVPEAAEVAGKFSANAGWTSVRDPVRTPA